MVLNQVRMGEVVHHIPTDQYARVIGLRLVGDRIHFEINQVKYPTDASVPYRIRQNPVNEVWDPEECISLTPTEYGQEGNIYYLEEQTLLTDREV